jgi:hypothetical protein
MSTRAHRVEGWTAYFETGLGWEVELRDLWIAMGGGEMTRTLKVVIEMDKNGNPIQCRNGNFMGHKT